MFRNLALLASLSLGVDAAVLQPRLDDGVANTPPMGFVLFAGSDCSIADNVAAGAATTTTRVRQTKLPFAQMQRL